MESNDFMLQLQKKLLDEKKVAESTASAYIKSLYAINGKKVFKNLSFLKNTEEVDKVISTYAENTQRALYATISSVLGLFKDKAGFKKPYTYYFDKVKVKKAESNEEPKHEKSEKQKEAWIGWEDVEKKKSELSEEVDKFLKQKTIDGTQYEKLLNYFILSLYTDIQPRRNKDYLEMFIVKKHSDKMPTDKNYLDVATKKFFFNTYKTSKKYGSQSADIPESLWKAIETFFKYHPLWKEGKKKNEPVKLLVNFDGSSISAVNSITRILNKVFGKKVSSSMIRHIFLSDKYKDTIGEMEKDQLAMGHSSTQQSEYVKN